MCGHTQGHDEQLVVVQLRWDDWRTAHVRVGDLENIHWSHPSGAPRPLIHASVSCRSFVSGHLPHDCDERTAHRVEVCILKSHATPCVFQDLVLRASFAEIRQPATATEPARSRAARFP